MKMTKTYLIMKAEKMKAIKLRMNRTKQAAMPKLTRAIMKMRKESVLILSARNNLYRMQMRYKIINLLKK